MRSTLLLIVLLAAVPGYAGPFIEFTEISTYDTGTRLLNGQWRLGSSTKMRYINSLGNEDTTTWRTRHLIEARDGSAIADTNWQHFTSSKFWSIVEGVAEFRTCYRGHAIAFAGGTSQDIGANEICTGPPPYNPDYCDIHPTSEECGFDPTCPLILNLGSGPWRLTGSSDPVRFDLDADGTREPLTWTAPQTQLAFLAHDRDGSGMIDDGTELFGNAAPTGAGRAANGFEALLALDDNGDDVIDAADLAWRSLLLWTDTNHDGVSQPAELARVSATDLQGLSLRYHWTARADQHGNVFRYEAVAQFARGARPYYDVYFVRAD